VFDQHAANTEISNVLLLLLLLLLLLEEQP
jgi:hypothetical protein